MGPDGAEKEVGQKSRLPLLRAPCLFPQSSLEYEENTPSGIRALTRTTTCWLRQYFMRKNRANIPIDLGPTPRLRARWHTCPRTTNER